MSKIELFWEELSYKGERVIGYTYRAKILGGWIVRTGAPAGVGVTFVPDPKHEWKQLKSNERHKPDEEA